MEVWADLPLFAAGEAHRRVPEAVWLSWHYGGAARFWQAVLDAGITATSLDDAYRQYRILEKTHEARPL